jgi:hypothetical protein
LQNNHNSGVKAPPFPALGFKMVKNRKDFKLAIGFVAFSLFCFFYLIPSQVGPLTRPESLMPVIMVGFIFILAVFMLIKSLRASDEEEEKHVEESSQKNSNRFALPSVMVMMLLLSWLMDSIGFLLSSSITMIILFLIFEVKNIKQILLITFITIAVLYISFEKFFYSPLPVGTIVEKLLG